MSKETVTLATFTNPIEAQLVKNRLEAEGIPAFLDGETAQSLFGGMGAAFGMIRLRVAEDDLDRAVALLGADEEEDPLEPELEPNTAIQPRAWALAEPQSAPNTDIRRAPPDEIQAGEKQRLIGAEEEGPGQTFKDEEDEPEEIVWTAETYATRAWRTATVGVVLGGLLYIMICHSAVVMLPLPIYSLWLAGCGLTMPQSKDRVSLLKLVLAVVLDIGVLLFAGLAFLDVVHLALGR